MNTPQGWHNNRTKGMISSSLFDQIIKLPSQEFIKLGIESQNVQLINLNDNNQDKDLKIKNMSTFAVSTSLKNETKLFDVKTKDMVTLKLKEYAPINTLKPLKTLNK